MLESKYISLDQVLLCSNRFKTLLEKVNQITAVQTLVHNHLSHLLHAKCYVSNLENDTLTLTTPSASFAHQIRFNETTLLTQLKKHPMCQNITHIRAKVAPIHYSPPLATILAKPRLSSQNANHLHATALNVDCPKLRIALLRLAKHAD